MKWVINVSWYILVYTLINHIFTPFPGVDGVAAVALQLLNYLSIK